jgi:hypothetical protein
MALEQGEDCENFIEQNFAHGSESRMMLMEHKSSITGTEMRYKNEWDKQEEVKAEIANLGG